jgi:ABC-type amino acid transport substrate-binding protein
MRKFLPSAIIVVFLLSAIPAIGCGDKLVGLTHGAHYMNLAHPGVILVFAPAGSTAANLIADEQFQTAIKKDRHVLRVATDEKQLAGELSSGKFDVVLTDANTASEMNQHLQAHSSPAIVVPVVEAQTKSEIKALAHQYPVVVAAHSKTGKYRAAMDDAMEARMQNGEPMTMASK